MERVYRPVSSLELSSGQYPNPSLIAYAASGNGSGLQVTIVHQLIRFFKDETAATAIEYGLIAGLISVVILASLKTIGTNLNTKFKNIGSALN